MWEANPPGATLPQVNCPYPMCDIEWSEEVSFQAHQELHDHYENPAINRQQSRMYNDNYREAYHDDCNQVHE